MAQQRGFIYWPAAIALLGLAMRPGFAAPPDADAKGLPAGWSAAAIGTDETLTDKQSASYENGVLTLQAGGAGLGGDTDGGLFVYRNGGNGSIRARLVSQQDADDDGLTQTTIAIRESTDHGSPVLRLAYTSGNQLVPEVRATADSATAPVGDPGTNSVGLVGKGTAVSPPAGRPIGDGIWLGIERDGTAIRFYWSNDGTVWNQIARATTQISATALVGFEASKHGGAGLATSRLDNIAVDSEMLAPRALAGVAATPRDGSAIVTWNPAANAGAAVSYNVYAIDVNAFKRTKLNAAPITGSSFLAEGLKNGEKYWFGVTAVVNGAESGLQVPEPNGTNQNGGRRVGVVIPGPAVLGGLQLHHVGIHDPASISVSGEGAAAKITFRAAGTNVWETGDGIPFLAIPVEGDVDISARVVKGPSASEGGGWEHGGVMIRESLDPGSRFVYAEMSLENRLEFKRRRAHAQSNVVSFISRDDNTARPISMRLVRRGDTFEGSFSEDSGKTWQPLGDPASSELGESNKDTLPGFAKSAYAGLTLCPHFIGQEGKYTEAEFDQIVIKAP